MPETPDAPRRLTVREAAAIAQVDASTIRKWVRRGRLPAVQREPQILIDRDALEQFRHSWKPPPQRVSPDQQQPAIGDDRAEPVVAFSRQDAAVLLDVHPDTINRWRRQGHLQATPQGLIPLAEIERLTKAAMPKPADQLELLGDPIPSAAEAAPSPTPLVVLLHLLEASRQREKKLTEQLDAVIQQLEVMNTLLLRLTQPGGAPPTAATRASLPLSRPQQVLNFLRQYPGRHTSAEVREALGLDQSPKDIMRGLIERGLVKRHAPGVFEAILGAGKAAASSSTKEPEEGSLLARVLAYVRDTTGEGSPRRGVRSWQIQQALTLPRRPSRELSRLNQQQLIYRIRKGVYSARPLEVEKETEQVEEEDIKNK